MGVSLCWLAVKDCGKDAALEELGFEPVGEPFKDLPDRMGVVTLPNGWLLFVFNHDLKAAFEDRFTALSRHGPAVACAIEEHVMFQEARGYGAGAETWRITHDPDENQSLYHLEVSGQPPANFETLHRKAVAVQDSEGGEDAGFDVISDIPLDVAESICGFRHDGVWPDNLRFVELRKTRGAASAPGQGLFSRLFGRR